MAHVWTIGNRTIKLDIMKTKRIMLAIVTVLFTTGLTNAQDKGSMPNLAINSPNYKTAIGIRGGETSGLTVKQFVRSDKAIEGIIGFWHRGLSGTILFEKYAPAFNVSGLNWYYGAGGHVAFETGGSATYYRNDRHNHYRDGSIGLGVDGLVGMEYKIPSTPLALSLDVKPYVEVVTKGSTWFSLDPGLGIKVVF